MTETRKHKDSLKIIEKQEKKLNRYQDILPCNYFFV